MARKINRLSARTVATLKEPGRYADGGNLYLSIRPGGSKQWTFMHRWENPETRKATQREISFGPVHAVSLASAREMATAARAQLAQGNAPTSPKTASRTIGRTFGEISDEVVKAMSPGWRSEKHAAQWTMTLTEYAGALRPLPVDQVTTDDVLAVLRPVWNEIPDTAGRLRGRIERVLDAAKAQGLRSGENPARWRGHLDQLLPKRQRIDKPHHAAMPYPDLPKFMAALRAVPLMSARALEFVILTAARTGEMRGMQHAEISAGLWTIPAGRMKGGREHTVPLSKAALAIVGAMPADEFVFAGRYEGAPLGKSTLERLLERMGVPVTVHGFRSSFRDWAGDCTDFSRDVIEAALAHQLRDQTEAAYRRSTALEKRRQLMEAWGEYCGKVS